MKHCNDQRSRADFVRHALLRSVLPAAALLFGAQGAWAACNINSGPYDPKTGWGGYQTKFIDMVVGPVYVPNEAKVGDRLLSAPKEFSIFNAGSNSNPNSNRPWDCRSGLGSSHGRVWQGKEVSGLGLEKVYTTNVPGIGIQLLRKAVGNDQTEKYYPHDELNANFGFFSTKSMFAVQLYKIADKTGSGDLVSGTYTTYEGDDGISVLTTVVTGKAITIITPTCSVEAGSRNVTVIFGKVPLSDFKGRGTTAAEKKFNIVLKCSAGLGVTNTVMLRMDATADPAGDAGVLQLSQDGSTPTASGVGIQLFNEMNKELVQYGKAARVGPSTDDGYVVPFTARYFQTGNKVTPGSANGGATFTIEYQ